MYDVIPTFHSNLLGIHVIARAKATESNNAEIRARLTYLSINRMVMMDNAYNSILAIQDRDTLLSILDSL